MSFTKTPEASTSRFRTLVPGVVAAFVLLVRAKRLLLLQVSHSDARLTFVRGVPGEPTPESTTIPCESVGAIGLSVRHGAPRGARLTVPIELIVRDGQGRILIAEPVFVAGLDADEELLDLVIRLGHAVGLAYYHVAIRDSRRYEVEATRIGHDRSEAIPSSLQPADYAAGQVLPGLVLPDQVLAAFDPSTPLSTGLRIGTWEPGRLITIVPRRASWRWAGGLVSAAAAYACVSGWWQPDRLPLFRDDAWVWLVAAGIPAALAVRLIRSGSFHARVDLRNGTVRVRHGLLPRRVALRRVTEVVLSRHEKRSTLASDTHHRSRTFYTYRLELHDSDSGPFPLLPAITTHLETRQRALFDALHPFSLALASALARSHRYVETEEAAGGDLPRTPPPATAGGRGACPPAPPRASPPARADRRPSAVSSG